MSLIGLCFLEGDSYVMKRIMHDRFWIVMLTITTLVGGTSLGVNIYKINGTDSIATATIFITLSILLVVIPWIVAYIISKNYIN